MSKITLKCKKYKRKCIDKALSVYLKEAGYDTSRVAVEVNGEIVPKRSFGETAMKDGDSVEVVGFVGGG